MCKKLLTVSILALWFACASHTPKPCIKEKPCASQTAKVDTRAAMYLIGRTGIGHACPVDGQVLSVAHVAQPFFGEFGFHDYPAAFAWSDELGNYGVVVGSVNALDRDLAIMRVLRGNPMYYRHAADEPKPGDIVYWRQYSHTDIFAPEVKSAKVLRVIAGYVFFDKAPMRGASGSCLLNERNEVVGLVSLSINNVGGAAVSIAGPWAVVARKN